jgi:hypothetical protein
MVGPVRQESGQVAVTTVRIAGPAIPFGVANTFGVHAIASPDLPLKAGSGTEDAAVPSGGDRDHAEWKASKPSVGRGPLKRAGMQLSRRAVGRCRAPPCIRSISWL